MNEDLVTDVELRQFLLGNVDDKVRELIESLFVTNPLRERMLAVEQELIEDYLEDSLNPADREKFIEQYAVTPAQRRKLRITKAIRDWAVTEAKAYATTISGWSRRRGRRRLKPMFVIPIAATAMIALIVDAGLLSSKIQQRSRRPDIFKLEPVSVPPVTAGGTDSAEIKYNYQVS